MFFVIISRCGKLTFVQVFPILNSFSEKMVNFSMAQSFEDTSGDVDLS